MRKSKFNAIIFKDHASNGFVYMKYDKDDFTGEAYKITLEQEFLKEEQVNGVFPSNKIVLASVRILDEEIAIIPKFCVELKFEGKPMNFWNVAENAEYLEYFFQKIAKKL